MKALLFINGESPLQLPDYECYNLIACVDGAFHYLEAMQFPMEQLVFISGDFDSHTGKDDIYREKFIHTPDQDKTDFEKALEILESRGVTSVDVYGGSGGEMDHFLGNLTVAYRFKNQLNINFYDEFSRYYFAPKSSVLENVKGQMISLYPFPFASGVVTEGLNWELSSEEISITTRIGTRNFAVRDRVGITYERGDLLIFIGKQYL